MKNLEQSSEIKRNYTVAIFGLGYVGLTFALALISKGLHVIGIDSDDNLIQELKRGETEVLEPNIKSLLNEALSTGSFCVLDGITSEIGNSIDVFVVTVGTPLVASKMDESAIRGVTSLISEVMADKALIIYRSTLGVGVTRDVILPILQKSKRKFFLAMCPERTIEGRAIEEIFNLPQVVGGIDIESTINAGNFFTKLGVEVLKFNNPESAELIKLANNSYRDLMFGFANEIAELCGALGLNSKEIIEGANYMYPRSNIARPGPSGGACLTKDPWILYTSGKQRNVEMKITKAARERNESHVITFIDKNLLNGASGMKKVSFLGLSFKGYPKTRDIRGSSVHDVLKYFQNFDEIEIHGFEPAGKVNIKGFIQSESLDACIKNSDLILILTNAREFEGIEEKLSNLASPEALVLDFWNLVDATKLKLSQNLRVW